MSRSISRFVVRLALIAASLAWAGFVFTSTVGDPGRGERIASAVLADDGARAEVVAPITSTVVRTAGLSVTDEPAVARQVDALLQNPTGARSFIDPFAGQWANVVGGTDGLATSYDVGPLLDQIIAATPGAGQVATPDVGDLVGDPDTVGDGGAGERLVPGVPLPRTNLGWLLPSRDRVAQATNLLGLLAAVGVASGFAIGSRRWVLRRVGVWAVLAGSVWAIIPIAVMWAVQRWASGVDSIVGIVVDEAVVDVRPVAIVMVVAGLTSFVVSFAPMPGGAGVPHREDVRRDDAPRSRVERQNHGPAPRRPAATAAAPMQTVPQVRHRPTTPIIVPMAPPRAVSASDDAWHTRPPGADDVHEDDDVWNFYS